MGESTSASRHGDHEGEHRDAAARARPDEIPLESLWQALATNPRGLSRAEAARRLADIGPNAIPEPAQRSLPLRLLAQFTHFFALVLWAAAAFCFIAEWRAPGGGMRSLGFAIVGVIVVNGLFSFVQEYRAERSISALQRFLPSLATVIREGAAVRLSIAELVPGDVLLLEEGDRVPADCRIVESTGALVSLAALTGESEAEPRGESGSASAALLRSENVLLAGCYMMAGHARAVVFATGARTEFGKIAASMAPQPRADLPLEREVRRLARLLSAIAVGLGLLFFGLGRLLGLPIWDNLIFAIGIIVANVPEGLMPTLTLALAASSVRMARRNALVRRLVAVETLGSTTVICTDKTGTLTSNQMSVAQIFAAGARFDATSEGLARLAQEHPRVVEAALGANALKVVLSRSGPEQLGDPMELALRRMAEEARPGLELGPRLLEIPFNAERRRQVAVHSGREHRALVFAKGAPEVMVALCTQGLGASGPEPLDEALRARYLAAAEEMAARRLRVLALAYRELPGLNLPAPAELESGLVLAALVGLEDPPRPEVRAAVQTCHDAGIRIVMITGDSPATAESIAREVGLLRTERGKIISGEELEALSEPELERALAEPDVHFARTTPFDKRRIVQALRRAGHIVAVTGDGVNDAPALREADIGIAMGKSGTDVARAAADLVLADDNFASIVSAVEEGRALFLNIRKFVSYVLTSNVPELVPYIAFTLFQVPLALTIIQILAVDLGTDMLPALALGLEPPPPGVMRELPSPQRRLVDRGLFARAYLFLGPFEALVSMAAFFFVLRSGGWVHGQMPGPHEALYLQATTACLMAIVAAQVVNVFCSRSETRSVFAQSLASNRALVGAVLVELGLALAITYSPLGHLVLRTAPIGPKVWLFMLPWLGVMLLAEEIRKALVRRAHRRSLAAPAPLARASQS